MPATDVTIEHYERQAVKEVILRYCQGEQGARALNSDEHWYKGTDDINHTVALRGPADYEDTIKRGRTLYATLDILEQAVFERDSKWDEKAGRPEVPLGTLAECLAFTMGTDIDGIGDIRSLAVKEAVEAAAQFHVDYLRERGIEKNVHCLYSGGGIYVHLHHGLFAVEVGNTDLTPGARKEQFQILCKAYNQIIGEISQAFFREHPEHIGRVKFDQLNNQKRTFKTIFSIHKRLPFAVIPLDPTAIKISFEKASLPLSDEVLQEGAQWYQSFDPSEKAALGPLLRDKIEAIRAVTRDMTAGSTDGEISRLEEPLDLADFAPCMKNIIEKAEDREGRHRALAVLATYLYQMGWPEDRAFDLWLEVADRCGVESRIFETTFGWVSCPLCSTMLQDTGGYPHLNLHGMGFCVPDEHCKGCQWPGDHHPQKILNEKFSRVKDEKGEPCFRVVTKNDPPGTIGVSETGQVQKVVERENGETGETFTARTTLSDCALRIDTETAADGETEYIFKGVGAIDKRQVCFTMPAGDMAVPAKFKAAVINAFGAENKVGKLTYPIVQDLSCNVRHRQRVTVPIWKNNIPLLPGVDLADNVEFRLSSKIPAEVCDGDLQAAKEVLRKLLKVHKFAPILVASILGSPAIARWHKKDRFGLGLWGGSGALKTSTTLAAMGIYGTGYLDGPKLKAGKGGSTVVGAMEVFTAAGFLPQIYDDVKTVDSKDAQNYVAVIHSVLEGEEKARGKKDGGLRESRDFACIPIVTGEVRPQEASTSARVLNLNWVGANGPLLTEVQGSATLLPVIGYHWLRFLADTDLILGKDFETFRSKKMEEFLGLKYTNPGRLATIFALLVGTWNLLEASPLGDVFAEAHESFKAALDEVIAVQGDAVTEETEISRFLSGLEELLASNPGLVMSEDGKKTIMGAVIGKRMSDGMFLLPTETLNELVKIRAFNQLPTVDSITQALNEKGLLIPDPDGKHLKYRYRFNGGRPWGWYLRGVAPPKDGLSSPGGDAKNDSEMSNVPMSPLSTVENERNIFSTKNQENRDRLEHGKEKQENGVDSGDSGDIDSIDRLVDSDFDSKVSVPNSDPTVPSREALVWACFRTDYRTDVDSVMHDFNEGDVIEVARWRAEAWQKRGIVDIVEAGA